MGVDGSISQLFSSESNATLHSQAGMTPRVLALHGGTHPSPP